jgi:Flp pilus assembly protein TadG
MRPLTRNKSRRRRGAIVVLTAVLLVLMLGLIAFAVDMGYVLLVRTQLQTAADSASLAGAGATNLPRGDMEAVAKQFAGYHQAAGHAIQLSSSDIEYGTWDTATRVFTPSTSVGNAVRVTTRTDAGHGGETPFFFARVLNFSSMSQSASAVATVNPRDIAFVIDLSGSMDDDTSPSSSTSTSLMQTVYSQLGFGAYPGSSVAINANKTDSWVMKNQLPSVMPNAIPTPNTSSSQSVSYWGSYFDYAKSHWNGQLGYKSYLDFMMYYGRDVKPDGANYTPLSLSSNLCACPRHSESVGGQSFSFPPNGMPTHAARAALIAAIQAVRDLNQDISNPDRMDWVSIVTFDTSTKVHRTLTSNYSAAMTACTELQAVSKTQMCTNTESGFSAAFNHIKPQSQSGAGRENANKIVILLTDGAANLKVSGDGTISSYIKGHPSTWTDPRTGATVNNWAVAGQYGTQRQAAMMQTMMMRANNWYVYPVGVGVDCDYDFMDRLARMGATANKTGQAPRGSGDPAVYQAIMTQIFTSIIMNPKLRLVQ